MLPLVISLPGEGSQCQDFRFLIFFFLRAVCLVVIMSSLSLPKTDSVHRIGFRPRQVPHGFGSSFTSTPCFERLTQCIALASRQVPHGFGSSFTSTPCFERLAPCIALASRQVPHGFGSSFTSTPCFEVTQVLKFWSGISWE